MISLDDAMTLMSRGARHRALPELSNGSISFDGESLHALMISFDWYGTDFIEVNASVSGLGRKEFAAWDFRRAPQWTAGARIEFPDLGETAHLDPIRLIGRTAKINGNGLSHLGFNSAESLVRDAAALDVRHFDSRSDASSSIAQIIRTAAPIERFSTTLAPKTFLDDGEILEWRDYRNPWAIVQEICDLADAQCYHDGYQFRLENSTLDGQGEPYRITENTLIEFSFDADRNRFANAATIVFDSGITGTYEITAGDLTPAAIGRKTRYEDVPRTGGQGQAITRAMALTHRAANEGLTCDVQISGIPLMLRPSNVVQIIEESLTGVISSISFDLINASTSMKLVNIKGV